jgi:hypothetical protein
LHLYNLNFCHTPSLLLDQTTSQLPLPPSACYSFKSPHDLNLSLWNDLYHFPHLYSILSLSPTLTYQSLTYHLEWPEMLICHWGSSAFSCTPKTINIIYSWNFSWFLNFMWLSSFDSVYIFLSLALSMFFDDFSWFWTYIYSCTWCLFRTHYIYKLLYEVTWWLT